MNTRDSQVQPAEPSSVAATPRAEDEVVTFARDLIRIDTTNTGDPATSAGERTAAEYVAAQLDEVGYDVTYVESGAPGRGNVIARLEGADHSRGALLTHGHLDVVPADPSEWSTHPLSGEIADGYLWGRGAIDMKGMVGMTLAAARQLKRDGTKPARDLIFSFLADEEAGGFQGSRWLVEHRRDLFDGATEAIGEVGGFSITLSDEVRAYLIETAEKGIMWLRLQARGTPGHASMLQPDNAVAKLAAAVTRLHNHTFPRIVTPPVQQFLDGVTAITGQPFPEADLEQSLARLGGIARIIGATLRDTANVTIFNAGYKANVVPSTATAEVDVRVLPGRQQQVERELMEILGPDIEAHWDPGLAPIQTTFDGALVDRIMAAIHAEDPTAHVLPYMLSAGTDAKSFDQLGIRHFGFTPLKLPPDLDFTALFHGLDERVPLEALTFGTTVLLHLLPHC
jgi:acetylornithine deacetylase/succinyl-diaminopimelate desuccinylase-like protein